MCGVLAASWPRWSLGGLSSREILRSTNCSGYSGTTPYFPKFCHNLSARAKVFSGAFLSLRFVMNTYVRTLCYVYYSNTYLTRQSRIEFWIWTYLLHEILVICYPCTALNLLTVSPIVHNFTTLDRFLSMYNHYYLEHPKSHYKCDAVKFIC